MNSKVKLLFIVKQDDKNFGFLNIDVNGKTIKGTFYTNQYGSGSDIESPNDILDDFTISKKNTQIIIKMLITYIG